MLKSFCLLVLKIFLGAPGGGAAGGANPFQAQPQRKKLVAARRRK